MTRINNVYICGTKFKVKSNKDGGGSFTFDPPEITIDWDASNVHEIIIHECIEVIMTSINVRYSHPRQYGNHGFMFVFDHNGLDLITQELSGALKQFGIK